MQLKILSRRMSLIKRMLLAAIFIGLGFLVALLVLFFNFIFKNSIQSNSVILNENTAALSKQEQTGFGLFALSVGMPMRLKIPGINVDASIEYVGLTSDGAMDVPKDQGNVAWFEFGQRPGENGSAVIAGHYGWKNGEASVFDNLYKLRKGDKLYIEDDKGVIISFVVRENRRYDPEADASDVFSSNDGKSHLNLVTCEGTWDKTSKSYPKRLVIFTDKE